MTAHPSFALPVSTLPGFDITQTSVVTAGEFGFCLAMGPEGLRLLVQGPAQPSVEIPAFEGDVIAQGDRHTRVCPLTAGNAAALRYHLAWLRPRPLGQATSAGFGDRLGLATPGHIRALRAAGGGIAAVLAQQSVRENARTGRTPGQVLDDAMWGAFEEGWRDGYGADADHLKTTDDIDAFVAAGFSWFTIDPGGFVNGDASALDGAALTAALGDLPWGTLEDSWPALRHRYGGREFQVEGLCDPVRRRGAGARGREVRRRDRRGDHVVAPPVRRAAARGLRPRGLGGRDRDPDVAAGAFLYRARALAPRRALGEPRAALPRQFREGDRLPRVDRPVPQGSRRARRDRARGRAVQDQPALGIRQVQHLSRGRRTDARRRPPEDGRHELPRGAAHPGDA